VDWKGSRPDKLFALVYSIAALVQVRESSRRHWLAAAAVMQACAEGGRPDAAAPAVKLLLPIKPKSVELTDEFRAAFKMLFRSGRWAA
jgi:hypothetical protein